MRSFSNRQIERSLKMSLNKMTSHKMAPINVNQLKEEYNMKTKQNFLPFLVPALAVFVAVFGLGTVYYDNNLKVNSNILIDVNPSIVLSTNYQNQVIKVKALNDDGEEIIKDINVNKLSAEKATNIIIDELIEQGYLEGDGANILLTVQNNDLEKAKEIEATLLESVNDKLDQEYIAGTLLTQVDTIRKNIDEDIKKMMDEYNISYSKAIFISNIIEKDSSLKVEDLATLRINEISKLLNDKNIDISDIIGHNNEDCMYESAKLTQARKNKDEAEKNRIQAENKVQAAEQELQNRLRNQENTESAQKAYEEAVQARIRTEDKAQAAQNAYEEALRFQNQGESTQNTETNQNRSGETESSPSIDSNQSSTPSPSPSQNTEQNSTVGNGENGYNNYGTTQGRN